MLSEKNITYPVLHDEKDHVPVGRFTRIDGESYNSIQDYDQLDPFLMSIVSDSDHWMYISSLGGITAGRANPDIALFPYDSEDKLYQSHTHTGPCTAIWVDHPEVGQTLWEPFTQASTDHYRVRRHLYKSELENSIIFEEINQDLDMAFRYRWSFSEAFGFVRRATLANSGDAEVQVTIMDGLRNILAYGITATTHQHRHCLADAYKHSVIDEDTGLGIYMLSSMITDRPEPGETMYATTVWSRGLIDPSLYLRPEQLDAFRYKKTLRSEPVLKGRKAAFLLKSTLSVGPGQLHHWHIVADVKQNQKKTVHLRRTLREDKNIIEAVELDCLAGDQNLRRNVASADGLQVTGVRTMPAHHFANVLFNNMRGGVFNNNYNITSIDLARFIEARNKPVADRHQAFLSDLPKTLPVHDLLQKVSDANDADLHRLCYEYLPLYFSRRHGDPSRPWNQFDIRLKDEQGNRVLAYQGNWRDIFQNWEALCLSFPGFLPSIIAKFVNASTADGYNPYRITSDGIDWEVVEPDNPWSNIGYWGDHQIVYLLRLLEQLHGYYPDQLGKMLTQNVFSYADVPYRIKPYDQILEDPNDTIVFDFDQSKRVSDRVKKVGADGRLLVDANGQVMHVSLIEKLLVPALAKLSNLVLDGGLWLNTQRPEWNDANNALVGNGLSVVTLCYLRRYIAFCRNLFAELDIDTVGITGEVVDWLSRIFTALDASKAVLDNNRVDDTERKKLLDELGTAFDAYRRALYENGLSGKTSVKLEQINQLFELTLQYIDHSIKQNQREDGMYHAYNLMELSQSGDAVSLSHMYEMLEGQVAALSSGVLSTEQAINLLDALAGSAMYRDDQSSYMLYPNRVLPDFLEKNVAPANKVQASSLLREMLSQQDERIIYKDAEGKYRFATNINTAKQLKKVLDDVARSESLRPLVQSDTQLIKDLFEHVYHHKYFTGRSGTMYGYEGLGCIYWHMVAKLLLAVQESYLRAVEQGADDQTISKLADAYDHVRGGLGFNKTPVEYGAFPTDPYSHTTGHSGARQPGMTGQVKEEIITRHAELGLIIKQGTIRFAPRLIKSDEFLKIESVFRYYDIANRNEAIELPEGSIGFTICQVPVIYHLAEGPATICVTTSNNQTQQIAGDTLPVALSQNVFNRTGDIKRIDVSVPRNMIRD